MTTFRSPGRVAGLDYGTVRIGIAISDPGRTIASPYETYTRNDQATDAERLRHLVQEEQIVRFVVGLPVHMSGQESQKSQESREFARWVEEVTGVPVDLYDERYTTRQAEELLQDAQLTSQQRSRRRDMLAAQLILTAYLESGAQDSSLPESLD